MPDNPSKKAKILICDDERANLNLLINILKEDYQLVVAKDGHEAIERSLQSPPPDLILLDIMMPGINGYDACAQIKRDIKTSHIPVIFITAVSEMMDGTRGFAVGAVDYVTKPFYPPVVIARVENHLSLARAYRQLAAQNEQLKEVTKLREEINNITQHDLRNPLNAIVGMSQLLLEETLPADQQEMVETIRQAAFRMSRMINMSLDLVRIEKGLYKTQSQTVDLLPLLAFIQDEVFGLMESKKLNLRLQLDGLAPSDKACRRVRGEELLCHSILANLLTNACEAAPDNSLITVNITSDHSHTFIHIHNLGEVPVEIRPRFFDKYVTAGKQHGTGLGTYSARLMAEILGGTLQLDTQTPGQTTLSLSLPTAPPAP